MPDLAVLIYALAGLILLYKAGRLAVLGEPPKGYGKDWL